MAAHKDRQRRKWQAAHGRRGSSSTSSDEEDDEALATAAGGDGATTSFTTRAGRTARRPSLMRRAPIGGASGGGSSASGSVGGATPQTLKQASPSADGGMTSSLKRLSSSATNLTCGVRTKPMAAWGVASRLSCRDMRTDSDPLTEARVRGRRSASMSHAQVRWARAFVKLCVQETHPVAPFTSTHCSN